MKVARFRLVVSGSAQCFRTFRAELAQEQLAPMAIENATITETLSDSLETVQKSVRFSGVHCAEPAEAFRFDARITAPPADCSLQALGGFVPGHRAAVSSDYTDFEVIDSAAIPDTLAFESEGPVLTAMKPEKQIGSARMLGFFFVSSATIRNLTWSVKLPPGRRLLGCFPRNDEVADGTWKFNYSVLEAGSVLNASLLIG